MYLKLRPYRQVTVARRRNEKLGPRFFGPYEVVQRVGKVAYKLKLPAHCQIQPVFPVQDIPVILSPELEWKAVPSEILDIRKGAEGEGPDILVHWEGLPSFEDSWEPMSSFAAQYPSFHLEDKVSSLRGSIDRLRVPMAFIRRQPRSGGRQVRRFERKNLRSG